MTFPHVKTPNTTPGGYSDDFSSDIDDAGSQLRTDKSPPDKPSKASSAPPAVVGAVKESRGKGPFVKPPLGHGGELDGRQTYGGVDKGRRANQSATIGRSLFFHSPKACGDCVRIITLRIGWLHRSFSLVTDHNGAAHPNRFTLPGKVLDVTSQGEHQRRRDDRAMRIHRPRPVAKARSCKKDLQSSAIETTEPVVSAPAHVMAPGDNGAIAMGL
jgi:hypothetical protein